jgi:hypothetical protein
MAKNPLHHHKVKHMEVKHRLVNNSIDENKIELRWCPTDDMVADVLTKALPTASHLKHITSMGMRNERDLTILLRKV